MGIKNLKIVIKTNHSLTIMIQINLKQCDTPGFFTNLILLYKLPLNQREGLP